jgi:hypothetical protein
VGPLSATKTRCLSAMQGIPAISQVLKAFRMDRRAAFAGTPRREFVRGVRQPLPEVRLGEVVTSIRGGGNVAQTERPGTGDRKGHGHRALKPEPRPSHLRPPKGRDPVAARVGRVAPPHRAA